MMVAYVIEVAVVHLLLYLAYHLFLRKQTDYGFMRRYLIASVIIALLTPFLEVSSLQTPDPLIAAKEMILPATGPSTGVAAPEKAEINAPAETQVWQFSWPWIPAVISALFAIYFLYGLIQILLAYCSSHEKKAFGIVVRVLPDQGKTFTFWRCIFCPQDPEESVLRHEKGHADMLHSADVILLHAFRIFFWWTPSTWWALHELQLIHEYQADKKALQLTPIEDYKKTLINRTLSSVPMGLVSSYHHGTLSKRLAVMQSNHVPIQSGRIAIVGMLMVSIVLVFSCAEQLNNEDGSVSPMATLSDNVPQSLLAKLESIKSQHYPGTDYKVMELKGGPLDLETSLANEKYSTAGVLGTSKDGQTTYVAISKSSAAFEKVNEIVFHSSGYYAGFDEGPEFTGGDAALADYLRTNIQYPPEARRAGSISFFVYIDKDGSIDRAGMMVAKMGSTEVSKACMPVARTAIQNMPNWTPGVVAGQAVPTQIFMHLASGSNGEIVKAIATTDPYKFKTL